MPRDLESTNLEAAAHLAREADPGWDDRPSPSEYEDREPTEPPRSPATLRRDIDAIRRQIEAVEAAAALQADGRFLVTADDMVTLGWARVLCCLALGEEPR